MIQRVSRKMFLQISRELHSTARALGYRMVVHWRPISWQAVRNGAHVIGHVSGWCNQHTKRLVITVRGNASRARVLFVMRHELRHAEHAVRGLYADYYKDHRPLWDYAQGKLKKRPRIKSPSNRIAFLAETDCQRVAMAFLVERGIRTTKGEEEGKYPYTMTAAYQLNTALAVREAERGKRRKR